MSLAAFFQQMTGEELFEESWYKLVLLLQDSFGDLAFRDFYTWRPRHAFPLPRSRYHDWIIGLFGPFPPMVSKWLQSQPLYKKPGYYQVHFPCEMDQPSIVQSVANPSETSPHLWKNQKDLSLSFASQVWHDFCQGGPVKSLPPRYRAPVKFARRQQKAVWFFPEGFYIAPSHIVHGGYGLFTLRSFPAGYPLFMVQGQHISLSDWNKLPPSRRTALELFAFEASFMVDTLSTAAAGTGAEEGKDTTHTETYIINPLRDHDRLEVEDMKHHPNPAPWMNEPAMGMVSNVFTQPFTAFDIPFQDPSRYRLWIISARRIYVHQELLLHYNEYYARTDYMPGLACPDVLTSVPFR
jgi:hypothetical protein